MKGSMGKQQVVLAQASSNKKAVSSQLKGCLVLKQSGANTLGLEKKSLDKGGSKGDANLGEQSQKMFDQLIPFIQLCKEKEMKSKSVQKESIPPFIIC